MLLLTHTITGAVIGEKISNPIIISLIALASHFILDSLPHSDLKVPTKFDTWKFLRILPDIIPAILIYITFIFTYPDQWLTIHLGITCAILPDFLSLSKYMPKFQKIMAPLNNWHKKIQWQLDSNFKKKILGLLTQIIYITILIIILKFI